LADAPDTNAASSATGELRDGLRAFKALDGSRTV
jgi:hypothetical protein